MRNRVTSRRIWLFTMYRRYSVKENCISHLSTLESDKSPTREPSMLLLRNMMIPLRLSHTLLDPDFCRKSRHHRVSIPVTNRYTDWAIPTHLVEYDTRTNGIKFQHFGEGDLLTTRSLTCSKEWRSTLLSNVTVYQSIWRHNLYDRNIHHKRDRNVKSSHMTHRLFALCFAS